MVAKNYLKAAKLAFKLRQPGRLLSVVTSILAADQPMQGGSTPADAVSSSGQAALARLVAGFSMAEKALAFEYMRDWNTSMRHCHAAQALLHAVLTSHSPQVRMRCTRRKLMPQRMSPPCRIDAFPTLLYKAMRCS